MRCNSRVSTMPTLDAIEAINIDQLATATDRLLLRCKRTVQRPGRRSTIDFSREAAAARAASDATRAAASNAMRAATSNATPVADVEEQTLYVREAQKSQRLLVAAAIIVGAWLGVVCACLLT